MRFVILECVSESSGTPIKEEFDGIFQPFFAEKGWSIEEFVFFRQKTLLSLIQREGKNEIHSVISEFLIYLRDNLDSHPNFLWLRIGKINVKTCLKSTEYDNNLFMMEVVMAKSEDMSMVVEMAVGEAESSLRGLAIV